MIKIDKTEVLGWEAAIRGMRNPLNSWEKSDSDWEFVEDSSIINPNDEVKWVIGENDHGLMMSLAKAGHSHSKYRRMINVSCDINAPLYWWKEYDTYKVGTVANSTSTMHKIHAKEFTLEDFSCEHLFADYGDPSMNLNYGGKYPKAALLDLIHILNSFRYWFIETKDKRYWWQMIQLLPTSYNQLRTVQFNYEVLANMYHDRKNHKLDEWRDFCEWVESLPYSEIITGCNE